MSRLKTFISLIALLFAFSPFSVFAQSSQHSSGFIEIKVVDQNGNDIGGNWYLHEGQGPDGLIVRNGTFSENFSVPYGYFYFRGERKVGYSSFEVTSENPQQSIPKGLITFTLVYQKEAAPYTLPEETTAEEEMPTEEVPAEDDGAAMMEEEDTTPRIPDRSLLPERTPLHVDPPAGSETLEEASVSTEPEAEEESSGIGGPLALAQTGPASMLALLALSGMGSFCCIRRRRA